MQSREIMSAVLLDVNNPNSGRNNQSFQENLGPFNPKSESKNCRDYFYILPTTYLLLESSNCVTLQPSSLSSSKIHLNKQHPTMTKWANFDRNNLKMRTIKKRKVNHKRSKTNPKGTERAQIKESKKQRDQHENVKIK